MIGCLKNRKSHKVEVKQDKLFVPCAWISVVVIGLSILFIIISSFVNIGLVASWKVAGDYTQQQHIQDLVGAIMTLVILFVFVSVCAIPAYFEINAEKKYSHVKKH